jgi:hypothetical protein
MTAKKNKEKGCIVQVDMAGVGNLGHDETYGTGYFMRKSPDIDSMVLEAIIRSIDKPAKDIHDETCTITRLGLPKGKSGLSGDPRLTKSKIKYTVTGILRVEAKIVPDMVIPEEKAVQVSDNSTIIGYIREQRKTRS